MAVATARLRRTGTAISNGNSPLTGQPYLTRNSATFEDVTTFQQDYTALLVESCRRKPVEPLPPASVIHKNFPYLTMQGSLTQNTYKPPKVLKRDFPHSCQSRCQIFTSLLTTRTLIQVL